MPRESWDGRLAKVPIYSAPGLALWLLAVPAAVHLVLVCLIGLEADSSTEVLLAVALAAGLTGLLLGGLGHDPLTTAAACAWSPFLFARLRWYWALDMHSPGGSAQWIAGMLRWDAAPGPHAVAAIAAACALGGWCAARLNRRQEALDSPSRAARLSRRRRKKT